MKKFLLVFVVMMVFGGILVFVLESKDQLKEEKKVECVVCKEKGLMCDVCKKKVEDKVKEYLKF